MYQARLNACGQRFWPAFITYALIFNLFIISILDFKFIILNFTFPNNLYKGFLIKLAKLDVPHKFFRIERKNL
ncbi:MAG: hypothetical protein AAF960_30325, partial [Bacteroidota bacterium]